VRSAGQPFSKSGASNCYVSRGAWQISTRFIVVLEDDESAACFWHADSEHMQCCTTGAMFYLLVFFSSFYDSSFFLLEGNHYDCSRNLSLWLELWSCMMALLFWLMCVLTNGLSLCSGGSVVVCFSCWDWGSFPSLFFFVMCMLVVRTWTYYIA
jgi:hypothetical protein